MKKLILLSSCIMLCSCGIIKSSEGTRVGVVNKFSHKGIICKTWEGQLMMGGDAANYEGNNLFEFSATNKVAKKIQEVVDNHQTVALKYEQRVLPLVCSQRTQYMVVDLHVVEK